MVVKGWGIPGVPGTVAVANCDEDSPTKSSSNPIVGTWTFISLKINNELVTEDELIDAPSQIVFNSNGTGSMLFEDEEEPITAPMTWSTSGTQLTMQIPEEDTTICTYSVSGNTLTITFYDAEENPPETSVYTFTKV